VVGPLGDLFAVAAMYVPAPVIAEYVLPPGAPAVARRFVERTLLIATSPASPLTPEVDPVPSQRAGLAQLALPLRVWEVVRRIEAVRPYLTAALFEELEVDPGHVSGEVRRVTSDFTHLAESGH